MAFVRRCAAGPLAGAVRAAARPRPSAGAVPRARFSTIGRAREGGPKTSGPGESGPSGGPMAWYRETPTQRLAFQVTVAGTIAFVAYGTFRAWTDYIDPSAPSRDEAAVLSTPLIAGNPVVFFDLELDGKPMGRVSFQLRKVSLAPQRPRQRRVPPTTPRCAQLRMCCSRTGTEGYG